VSALSRQLYKWKQPQILTECEAGWTPERLCVRFGKEKYLLFLSENETRFAYFPVRSLIIMLTELSRCHYTSSYVLRLLKRLEFCIAK